MLNNILCVAFWAVLVYAALAVWGLIVVEIGAIQAVWVFVLIGSIAGGVYNALLAISNPAKRVAWLALAVFLAGAADIALRLLMIG